MNTLDFEKMENLQGGYVNKEVGCGISNMAAIGMLYFGPAGWLGAIGTIAGAYLAGCYERNY